ncbi:hypothetical protein HO133_000442 [Letharia lupina]|uniref:Sucrose transporter n=2 Tax=Letharia TaxID=112415 RepID=A0A8H6CI23_9LECA|nr:uncharacterized protein HO133_000442 [Letharia lupina]KAF6223599.1 hypothetical protein HO133_000442 [Letharia lupina]
MAQDPSASRPVSRLSKESSRQQGTTESHVSSPLSSAKDRSRPGSLNLNESSPLLSPQRSQDERGPEDRGTSPALLDWNEGEEEQSKSTFYLIILTLGIGGLQIAWATELSNGSPYLLSLGMSKSLLAFVWIAGPLSGTLVQPYIGIRSDNCRSPWGKRVPFMLAGAFATAISLLCLAWTREIVHGFLGLFGANPESHGVKVCSIIFAIIFVYVLDFAINTVQAGVRAFIVDYAPTHQQEDANSWAGRITGIGNILGYISGYVNLPEIFPWLGNTQFKVLCVIASVSLCGTIVITSLYIRERDPRFEGPPSEANPGILSFFRQVFNSIRRLPPQSRKVCEVQFFNWMGWFGFLFYITTWIGQLHVNPYFASHPDLTPAEIDKAWEDATRVGTFALLIFAITSFTSNMLLPFLVVPSYHAPPPKTPSTPPHHTPGTPGTLSASTYFFPSAPSPSPTLHARLSRLLDLCQIKWLTLRRAWLLSHILFALCMASTFFISTPTQATVLAGVVGLPWALSLWAPFALISAEISKRDSEARRGGPNPKNKPEDQAGVILGLHNVAVAAPQIVSTLVSSAIFKLAQKQRGEPYDTSVGWVLRFGGLAALVAAVFTWRIREDAEPVKGNGRKREGGTGEEERGLRDHQDGEAV